MALECVAKNNCRIVTKNCLSIPTPPSSPPSVIIRVWNRYLKKEAKQSEKIEVKGSKTKRKIIFLVLQKEAKRKRNGFCFASFRFEAKKKYKRKWDTLLWTQCLHENLLCGLQNDYMDTNGKF